MADISTELAAIQNAVYGEEVRGSIVDALEAMNENAESAEMWATGGSGGTASAKNNAKYYAAKAGSKVAQTDVAPTFSESKAYSAGDYVYYGGYYVTYGDETFYVGGSLYRFTADHAAGAWTGEDAEATTIQIAELHRQVDAATLSARVYSESESGLFSFERGTVQNTGANLASVTKGRSSFIAFRSTPEKIVMTDDTYSIFRVWTYGSRNANDGKRAIVSSAQAGTKAVVIVPREDEKYFRVVCSLASDVSHEMTGEDLTAISEKFRVYNLTDKTLTGNGLPADASVVGEKFAEIPSTLIRGKNADANEYAGLTMWSASAAGFSSENPASPSDFPSNAYTRATGAQLAGFNNDLFELVPSNNYWVFCWRSPTAVNVRTYTLFSHSRNERYRGRTTDSGATVSWMRENVAESVETAPPAVPATAAEVYALIAPYVASHSDEITAENLVTVDSQDVMLYKINTPSKHVESADDYTVVDGQYYPKPKVLIVATQHGNEKGSAVFMAELIRQLLEDSEYAAAATCVEWHIIPLANPTGFNANTRENYQGLDLNRDYSDNTYLRYGHTYGFQSAEAAAIRDLMLDNSYAAVIDVHQINYGASNTSPVCGIGGMTLYDDTKTSLAQRVWATIAAVGKRVEDYMRGIVADGSITQPITYNWGQPNGQAGAFTATIRAYSSGRSHVITASETTYPENVGVEIGNVLHKEIACFYTLGIETATRCSPLGSTVIYNTNARVFGTKYSNGIISEIAQIASGMK